MTDTLMPQQQGSQGSRRRLVLLAAAAVVLLLLLSLGAWLEGRSFGQLLDRIEASESVLERYNTESAAAVIGITAASPPRVRTAAVDRVRASAERALTEVLVDTQNVRDVRLWPWDRDAQRARERYVEHLAAWEKQLRGYTAGHFESTSAEISATFSLVNDALTDAVPMISSDYKARVAEIGRD